MPPHTQSAAVHARRHRRCSRCRRHARSCRSPGAPAGAATVDEKPLETDPEKAQMSIHAPAKIELVNKKIIVPSELEIEENPRARSAKLRVFKKL